MKDIHKVLIVEDEAVVAMCLKYEMETSGFDVLPPVTTGEEALAIIKKENPSLILLDIRLAGKLTGLDVAKSKETKANLNSIIFITGYTMPELKQEALKLNPAGFLEKPVEVNEIIQLLKEQNNQVDS